MSNHYNAPYTGQTNRFEKFHKVTKTHGREGKIPTYDCFLGRINSILPSLTLCSGYQKVFIMFILKRVPLNLFVPLWGKTEDNFQPPPRGFSNSISVPCWDVTCKSRELGASGSKWQQSRAWCPKKTFQSWYQCILEGRCSGLALAGHQAPTKVIPSLSTVTEQWRENATKHLWIEIRFGRDHSPNTIVGKTDLSWRY